MKEKVRLSYRMLARRAGFSSPVYLKLVMENKANLGVDGAEKVGAAVGLDENQTEYFRLLITLDQASTPEEKAKAMEAIMQFATRVKVQAVDHTQYEFYGHWYYSALLHLINILGSDRDSGEIGALLVPPIGKRDARKAVRKLYELGLIRKNSDGSVSVVSKHLGDSGDVASFALRRMHLQMGERAIEAIRATDPKKRHALGVSMTISERTYGRICSEMEQFLGRVVSLVDQDTDEDRVYRMNLQFFPLSRPVPSEKRKANEQ